MDYAVVNTTTTVVENVVVLEEGALWSPPEGTIAIALSDGFGIGDTWDGTTFVRTVPINNEPEPIQVISTGTQSL